MRDTAVPGRLPLVVLAAALPGRLPPATDPPLVEPPQAVLGGLEWRPLPRGADVANSDEGSGASPPFSSTLRTSAVSSSIETEPLPSVSKAAARAATS
jgi:hypothetical protein